MIGSEENHSWWEEQEETCVHHLPKNTPASCPLKINAKIQHPEGAYKQPELFPIASPRAAEAVSDLF